MLDEYGEKAFLTLSDSLKGVVNKNFLRASPPDPINLISSDFSDYLSSTFHLISSEFSNYLSSAIANAYD